MRRWRGGCLGVVCVAAGAISRLVHRGPGVGVLAEGAAVSFCDSGAASCSASGEVGVEEGAATRPKRSSGLLPVIGTGENKPAEPPALG